MKRFLSWVKASRPASQTYIFFPLVLGQVAAYHGGYSVMAGSVFWIHFFGLLFQLIIVYANDIADYHSDHYNQTYTIFSGGSRILVEGGLSLRQLKRALFGVFAVGMVSAVGLWIFFNKPFALFCTILTAVFIYAYSFPPLKLSYRGLGEALQTCGLAVIMPLFGYLMTSGSLKSLADFPFALFLVLFPAHFGGALTTAIPDEPSDKKTQKRTLAVVFGNRFSKLIVIGLYILSFFMLFQILKNFFSKNINPDTVSFFLVLPAIPLSLLIILFSGSLPGRKKLSLWIFFSILFIFTVTGVLVFQFIF